MEYLGRFPGNSHIGQLEPSILIDVILDRHSRLNTSDLQARLKTLDLPGGIFNTEQVTEFVDQMQVYEGAMYEISTKLEILDDEFQVRFSHDPIHHMERRLKSVNSIIGKLERKGLPLSVNSIKDNLFDVARQERAAQAKSGQKVGKTVLFFGCRKQSEDFMYQNEWKVSSVN